MENIKRLTLIFAIAPLLLLTISRILYLLPDDDASESFYWLAYVAEFIFLAHLLFETPKADWLYSIVLILIIVECIGYLIKIMHWPFAGVMMLCGLLGAMIMAGLFLYYSLKNGFKKIRYEQLILSICLFIQVVISINAVAFHGAFLTTYSKFLYYPIAALCGVSLLKKKYVNWGERNLMLYLLVHSLFVFIKVTFRLFA